MVDRNQSELYKKNDQMKAPEAMQSPQADTPSTPQRRKSPPPKPATWDQTKAIELASRGVSNQDIAALVGVHKNTVQLYLRRIWPELQSIQTFKNSMTDVLALNFGKCCSLENKLLDYFDDDDVLNRLDTNQKERLLGKITIAKGIAYDKLRLHEGKSMGHSPHLTQVNVTYQTNTLPVSCGPDVSLTELPSGDLAEETPVKEGS